MNTVRFDTIIRVISAVVLDRHPAVFDQLFDAPIYLRQIFPHFIPFRKIYALSRIIDKAISHFAAHFFFDALLLFPIGRVFIRFPIVFRFCFFAVFLKISNQRRFFAFFDFNAEFFCFFLRYPTRIGIAVSALLGE